MEGFTHSGQKGGDGNLLPECIIVVEKQMPDCPGSGWGGVDVLYSAVF